MSMRTRPTPRTSPGSHKSRGHRRLTVGAGLAALLALVAVLAVGPT
jgi:hypothetical protein